MTRVPSWPLLLLFTLLACAPDPLAPGQPRAASVVTLLRVVGPPPCIGFPEEPCSYADSYAPRCAAFALVRAGQTMLVTASHCVPESATNLTPLRFLAPSGWGHGLAYLLERNDAADVAFLALGEPDMVTPLRKGKSPLVGESVWSYNPSYRERSDGKVTSWLSGDFFETTQTVDKGWSGSPVLNANGDAVGVVSQCQGGVNGATTRCVPGRVVVTSALCFRAN
jgi:hypothetical protein